jgi:hypothetical protein
MKNLEEIKVDYSLCRQQVEEFRLWLSGKNELSEDDDVLPFFRARPHLVTLFGMFQQGIAWANRISWEFDIFGDFACDVAVGEWEKGAYCFVEFEDARRDSVFRRQGAKATREWGRRFDHGYSQIIDWVHKLDGLVPGADILARFGRYDISFEAVLVIGRDRHLDAGEKERFEWRARKVLVNTTRVICLTFDALLDQFQTRMGALTAAAEALAAASLPPPVRKPEAKKRGTKKRRQDK